VRGHVKFAFEAPNRTAPNWLALNWPMQSQIKACITKSLEVCALVRYYAVKSANSALTYQEKPVGPSFKVRKS